MRILAFDLISFHKKCTQESLHNIYKPHLLAFSRFCVERCKRKLQQGTAMTNPIKIRLIARSLAKPPSIISIFRSVVQGYHLFTKFGLFICLPLALHRGSWQRDGVTPSKRDLLLLLPGLHDQAARGQVRSTRTRKSISGNGFLFTPSSAGRGAGVYWWCDPAVEVMDAAGFHTCQPDWVGDIESVWRQGLHYLLKNNCISYL